MTSKPVSLTAIARLTVRTTIYASVLALAACASIAGVGGSAEFGCKAPVGVKCDSVSGTYYNAVQQNLPSQQKSGAAVPDASTAPTLMDQLVGKRAAQASSTRNAALTGATVTTLALAREANAPLRSPARVLRLWIKPWEDSDGDLHSQSYVYVPIDAGRWLIEHYRSPSREAYAPIRAQRAAKSAAPITNADVSANPRDTREEGSLLTGTRATALVRPSGSSAGDDDGR
jgi:conjugal transfer pilus assembly protein TraV